MSPQPLCIDLFCGLGGWTEGFLAEGYDVIGFDVEQHVYGDQRYPAQLVLQDVCTLHGSQFRDATIIVASSPVPRILIPRHAVEARESIRTAGARHAPV